MNIKIDALNYYGATKNITSISRRYGKMLKPMWYRRRLLALTPPLSWRNMGSPTWWCWRRAISATAAPGATAAVMAGIGHDIEAVKSTSARGLETLFKIANLGAGIIRERIRKYNIDADFVPGYGYLAYNQRQLKTLRQWEKEFKAATRMKRSNCIPEKRCSRWWAPRSTAAR